MNTERVNIERRRVMAAAVLGREVEQTGAIPGCKPPLVAVIGEIREVTERLIVVEKRPFGARAPDGDTTAGTCSSTAAHPCVDASQLRRCERPEPRRLGSRPRGAVAQSVRAADS